jgi:hypothetical protein
MLKLGKSVPPLEPVLGVRRANLPLKVLPSQSDRKGSAQLTAEPMGEPRTGVERPKNEAHRWPLVRFFRRPMQNDPQRFVNNSQCGGDSRTIPPSIKPFLDLPNRHREDHFLLCVRAYPITLHRPCRVNLLTKASPAT